MPPDPDSDRDAPTATPDDVDVAPGAREHRDFEAVREGFADPDHFYGPFVFWFWDAPLDDVDHAEMAARMAAQDLNPGYAHARHTMVDEPSLDPDEEWLSEDWFDAFGDALDAAEDADTYLGYVDEYMWPSMQAAGRVVEERSDLEEAWLTWETLDVDGGAVESVTVPDAFAAVAARLDDAGPDETIRAAAEDERHRPATVDADTLRTVEAGAEWTVPDGAWRVYAFHHNTRDDRPNYLDADLAETFLDVAVEPYADRFGDRMGDAVPGDFVDNEGDYGRLLAWSGSLARRYRERHDRDVWRDLGLLVDADADGRHGAARCRWFETVSDLYAQNYATVTEYHEARDMYTTGHFWEESLAAQVRYVGDHLEMQRAFSMPGQDCLGDSAMAVHDFKEAQSVAEFGDARFMTEYLGAGAAADPERPWSTFVPTFLKRSSNAIFAWGASHVIPHGVFTSRTLEGHPWPPDWYDENPTFPYLDRWAAFVRRASFVHSQGDHAADVFLLNPMPSVWALSGHEAFDPAFEPEDVAEYWTYPEQRTTGERVNEIDDAYADAMEALTAERVEYLVGDRRDLGEMAVEDGRLVADRHAFDAVILPPLEVVSRDVARRLLAFARDGGHVYHLDDLPAGSMERGFDDPEVADAMAALAEEPTAHRVDDLADAVGRPGLERHVVVERGDCDLLQHHRRVDGRDVVWLANDTGEFQRVAVRLRDAVGAAEVWHPETGETFPLASTVDDGDTVVSLSFDPREAYWLVVDPAGEPRDDGVALHPPTETVATVEGPWRVSYDPDDQPTLEHPVDPPAAFADGVERDLAPWTEWGVPESFSGRLDYRTTVTLAADQASGTLWLDLGEVAHAAAVWVDGERVGARLWPPHRVEVTDALDAGENELRVRVANLVNNNYGDARTSGLLGPVRVTREP